MKRPVGSILLGLFLLSQIVLQGGRLWPALPVIGRSARAPVWTAALPTGVRLAAALPGTLVLAASNGEFWQLPVSGSTDARPIVTHAVDQELPGGVMITAHLARLGGAWRLVAIDGASYWPSPDGRAAAVYDRLDRAFWAVLAEDVRPRPLGAIDPAAPAALVWSATGDRLAYLSGQPARLWSWHVGSYAEELTALRGQGRPVAVQSGGTLVLADAVGGEPALYVPRVGTAVPLAAGRVLAVAPDGQEALLAHGNRVYLTDLDEGAALALPLAPADVSQAVWSPDGAVAVLDGGGVGAGRILLATLKRDGAHWLRLPKGTEPATGGLVALRPTRLVCVLTHDGEAVTYVRSLDDGMA